MALLSYEDSMCGGCGQPKDIAYNPDADGWFEAEAVTCAGCAAQQQHGRKEGKEAPAGQKVYVVDSRPPDLELMPWRLGSGPRPDDDPGDDQADA